MKTEKKGSIFVALIFIIIVLCLVSSLVSECSTVIRRGYILESEDEYWDSMP